MLQVRLLLTAASVATSATSFAAHTLFLRAMGASGDADQLFTAMSVPVSAAGLLTGVAIYVLPTRLVHHDAQAQAAVARALGIAMAMVSALLVLGCLIIAAMTASPLFWYLSAGAAAFAGLSVASGVLSSVAQARGRFADTAVAPVLTALGLLGGAGAAMASAQAWTLLAGQLAGTACATAYLAVRAKLGRVAGTTAEDAGDWKRCSAVLGPLLRSGAAIGAGTLAFTLFPMLDALLGQRIGEGAVTVLAYCQRIAVAASTAISMGAYVMAARWSHDAVASGGRMAAWPLARREALQATSLGLAAWAIYRLGGDALLSWLMASSSLQAHALHALLDCAGWMLLGVGPMAAMPFLFRVFYTLGDYGPPALIAIGVVAGYATLAGVRVDGGVVAVAQAYALVWWLALAAGLWALRRAVRRG